MYICLIETIDCDVLKGEEEEEKKPGKRLEEKTRTRKKRILFEHFFFYSLRESNEFFFSADYSFIKHITKRNLIQLALACSFF